MSGESVTETGFANTTVTADDQTPFSFGAEIAASIFIVPMMIFGIIANSITLIVILQTRRLRTVVNILIVSLSFSDLLSAIISPLNLYRRTWGFEIWNLPKEVCKFFNAIDVWTSGVTALHILLFSFIRLVSLKWPYEYKRINMRHVQILICLIWLITFGCGAVPAWLYYTSGISTSSKWPDCTLDPDWFVWFTTYSKITYPILVFIPMLATAILTALAVLVMLNRRASRERKAKPAMSESVRIQMQETKRRNERKENHAMLQLGLIAGSFMFGYIPITSYAFYTTSHRVITLEEAVVDWNYGMTAYILLRISECLNPIFYNVSSTKLRRETKTFLGKICKCQSFAKCTKNAPEYSSASESSVGGRTRKTIENS